MADRRRKIHSSAMDVNKTVAEMIEPQPALPYQAPYQAIATFGNKKAAIK